MSNTKDKATDTAKPRKPKKSLLGRNAILLFGLLSAIMFLPTTLVIVVGMLPTPMVAMVERTGKRLAKAVTVGAMNLAGCSLFVVELWSNGQTFDRALSIITDPTAIIVMYGAASAGYVIDWAMTGLVANVMYERGKKRQKDILLEQEALVERWGREVKGEDVLDEDGFAIERD